ncbi:MAG: DUF1343 domain-containing protein [Flavobacteriales bacterium]|nr:DUF1343 domain-containing protein [Flavobacteriales bacterium]
MKHHKVLYILLISCFHFQCTGQTTKVDGDKTIVSFPRVSVDEPDLPIITGAAQTDAYIKFLNFKKVGIVANHTSTINNTHLVDSLVTLGIHIVKVFSPEHGFRGEADAGEEVASGIDAKTKLPLISLYGNNKKPTPEQLKGIEVMIFDIQVVGARFYTYISTMHYVMEACAENKIRLVILDRPNPNGHFVDGPILEEKYKSFVGLHPVPIVHGMTIGEYAQMLNGEKWLKNGVQCTLTIIPIKNYTHNTIYELPIKPSPNLKTMSAVYLYPSLCLFEGTPISVGRGTEKPFQIIGHPTMKSDKFTFTPKSMEGAKDPKYKNQLCFGHDLTDYGTIYMRGSKSINLFWLINSYKDFPEKEGFFNEMFNLLAGTNQLQMQIKAGKTEEEIKATWQKGLISFKSVRKKYLLYKDFE